MANAVKKVNGIAIADIKNINGITDTNLKKLNTLEFAGVTDAHTLISTHTASSSSSIDITSGIDSTYDVYEFIFTNMHPATNQVDFTVQFNASGGSGFNETITSTIFVAYHGEGASSGTHLGYNPNEASDQANGTAYQNLTYETGSDNDQACSGILTLYDPSSTTYVKHFTASTNFSHPGDITMNSFIAGYINDTTAIDEISFKFSSGNIDAGTIYMYGVS